MISFFGFISKRYTFILDIGVWEPVERIGWGVRKSKVVEGTIQKPQPTWAARSCVVYVIVYLVLLNLKRTF